MSNTNGLITKNELHRIMGGWRRYLNPFSNTIKRIEDATKNNPMLCRKALWSIQQYGVKERLSLKPDETVLFFSPLLAAFSYYINIPIIGCLCFISISILLSMVLYRREDEKRLICAVVPPLLATGVRITTGYPELDALFAADPFEVENTLINGGMQSAELTELNAFAQAMVSGHQELPGGSFAADNIARVSPRNCELVERATKIMSDKVTPSSSS